MRDLKADLELCKQVESDWEKVGTRPWLPEELYGNFAHVAREGWPHAIERALEAEALARELVEALGNHTLFSPEKRTMAEWDECEKRLEEVYLRAKEVLGDEDQAK